MEEAGARQLGKEVGKTECSTILLIWPRDGDVGGGGGGGGGIVVVAEVVGQGLNDQ